MERPDLKRFGHALEWANHGDVHAFMALINLASNIESYIYYLENQVRDQQKVIISIQSPTQKD